MLVEIMEKRKKVSKIEVKELNAVNGKYKIQVKIQFRPFLIKKNSNFWVPMV